MATAQAALWPENAAVWQLFHALATRATVDLGIGGVVLQHALEDLDTEEGLVLVAKIAYLYDQLCPPEPPRS